MIFKLIGMCLIEFVIEKVFESVTESIIDNGFCCCSPICKLGAPFAGALI